MTFSEAVLSAWDSYELSGEIQIIFCFTNMGTTEEPIYGFCPMELFLEESDNNLCWSLNIDSTDDILPLGEVDGTGFDLYDHD